MTGPDLPGSGRVHREGPKAEGLEDLASAVGPAAACGSQVRRRRVVRRPVPPIESHPFLGGEDGTGRGDLDQDRQGRHQGSADRQARRREPDLECP